MPEQQNARRGGRAKETRTRDSKPRGGPRQGPRLPRPDELKARIDPATFYAREIPEAPTLKAGRGGWSQNFPCPFHEDETGSLGVNLKSGAFKCFGCGTQGGSVVDFIMARESLDLDGARAALGERYGIAAGEAPGTRAPSKPRSPKPDPAPDPHREPPAPIPAEVLASRPQVHPKHGRPSATWTYTDAAWRPIAYVMRFDPAEGRKVFSPQTWTPGDGWQWKAPAAPRPLYRLPRLAGDPEAPAVFCEGEKAADAAAALLPDLVPLATWGGAQAPRKSDFGPLAGRRVRIWPDNDPPGASYAATVAELARAAGAVSVEILDLSTLARDPVTGEPRTLVKGYDAADALRDGWTPETFAAAARWRAIPGPGESKAPDPEEAGEGPPFPFELRDGGIYYQRPAASKGAKAGGDDNPPLWICPPFRVLAVTRSERGEDFGRLAVFKDLDAAERREVIRDAERQGSGDGLRARLAALGFEVASHPEGRRQFLELLRRWTPEKRARSVTRTGWTEDGAAYVLPDRTLGETGEPVILAAEGERPEFTVRGTVADWREHVGRLCIGNSRLLFVVSLALAPPLLRLVGAREGGGFHLKGSSTDGSSGGKTTCQRVAASVYGAPETLQRWRTTDNGLESVAELHNDMLLNLDDLNDEVTPQAAGAALYMLAGGTGRQRMDRSGGGRPVKRWRLLFLSSGEAGLSEHLAAAQRRAKAGQAVRMAEIPADAGAGLGVFEELHGYPDGGALALALTDAAATFYGAPFVAFVEALIRHRAELPAVLKTARDGFVSEALAGLGAPSGQVRRVAARFALVAAAGELATDENLTGWPPGAAKAAALRCFRDWVAAQGGAGPSGERDLIAQVRYWIEAHANRFRWRTRGLDDHAPEVPRAAGFKEENPAGGITFWCFPETFKREAIEGHDPTEAARVLIRARMLKPAADGRPTQKVRLPGFRDPTRVYVFTRDMAGEAESEKGTPDES